MDPYKQRITIAEHAGWEWRTTDDGVCECWHHDKHEYMRTLFVDHTRDKDDPDMLDAIPDYLSNLNAMAGAETYLGTGKRWNNYVINLGKVCAPDNADHILSVYDVMAHEVINADAYQRAEAFLKTLNLWEDDE